MQQCLAGAGFGPLSGSYGVDREVGVGGWGGGLQSQASATLAATPYGPLELHPAAGTNTAVGRGPAQSGGPPGPDVPADQAQAAMSGERSGLPAPPGRGIGCSGGPAEASEGLGGRWRAGRRPGRAAAAAVCRAGGR